MKRFLAILLSFTWMSFISIGLFFLFFWLLHYCFFSAWWKVLVMAIFGAGLFITIWNLIVPQLVIVPVGYVATKLKEFKASAISAAVPPMIVGIQCIVEFWLISKCIPFDAKDWVSAIVWNAVVFKSYFALIRGFFNIYLKAE